MGLFGEKKPIEVLRTEREFQCGKFRLTITENGYLEFNDNMTIFRFYLKHIDTVSYYIKDKGMSEYGLISLNLIGQGVVLGSIQFGISNNLKDHVQEWLIERIEAAK